MKYALSRRAFLSTALGAATLPLMRLSAVAAGPNSIELVAKKSQINLAGPGSPASTLWTYNGVSPGPLLRAKRGEVLAIRFKNELDEPTSVHWHGIRIKNAMDGVSGLTQDPVPPGESFDYEVNLPDAGTFWYHAHNESWKQVAMGLYGPLIVDEDDAPAFAAANDITLVFDDWRLGRDGTFDAASLGSVMDWAHQGRLGNYLTVNGVSQPTLSVPAGQWLRLRFINAANSRILAFSPKKLGGRIIALDGQPVTNPGAEAADRISLGPAQRMDLVVKFDQEGTIPIEEITGDPFMTASLQVTAATEATSAGDAPRLSPAQIAEPDLANAQQFEMSLDGGAMSMASLTYNGRRLGGMSMMTEKQMWGLNGIANMSADPFFSVPSGQTVVVTTINRTNFSHAMHTHGHHFRIVERNGQKLAQDAWRDTFLIAPREEVKIAFVADNKGKWLYHCHMLEHAAGGMTTWFAVT